MVRKCSVGGCTSNYDSQRKGMKQEVPVYGFPKDCNERTRWLASLPNIIEPDRITVNFGVCANHFPEDVPKVRRGSHLVPAVPPSIFYNVQPSCIPTASTPRPTTKSSSSVRSQTMDIDEMAEFRRLDSFGPVSEFVNSFKQRFSDLRVASWNEDKNVYVVSDSRVGPVHSFSMYCDILLDDHNTVIAMKFELFKKLKAVNHHTFSRNVLHSWSQLEELVRFLKADSDDKLDLKEQFVLNQVKLQNTPRNSRLYTIDDLCLGLSWCNRSRSLYTTLRKHMQLPSLTTLSRISRTVKNTSNDDLYRTVFNGLEERCKSCIIIIDEIYVKASISYRGGVLFGYAVDQPDKKATTLLCMMVKCMFGGPTFVAKMLPCAGLKACFQFECLQELLVSLERCGARVVAIINDNNKVNQSCFKMFTPIVSDSPWIVKSPSSSNPLFLLYDPVHLTKNIRNNWITDKTKTISFPTSSQGNILAKWSDLEELHATESNAMVKLSKLTKASIAPSNIEKQKVSLVLQVFSDETSCALKTSSHATSSWHSTASFIDKVIVLWKLFNCKGTSQEHRLRDPHRITINLGERGEAAIQTLKDWARIADSLRPSAGIRMRSLTKDTAEALAWTCRCFIDLARHLLTTQGPDQHRFVCLGFFQQDDLERHFGYLRMSAGCNYYLTVQDIIHTHTRDMARLMLKHTQENELDIYTQSNHTCNLCNADLTDAELLLVDDMTEGEVSVPADENQAVFYIAGYLASKRTELAGVSSDTSPAVQDFMKELNRGGLTYPCNSLFTLALLAYYFFTKSPERFCRNRLTSILVKFPQLFRLDIAITMDTLRRLANILMKRYCIQNSQQESSRSSSSSQQNRKIAKLSSQAL